MCLSKLDIYDPREEFAIYTDAEFKKVSIIKKLIEFPGIYAWKNNNKKKNQLMFIGPAEIGCAVTF